MAQPPALPSPCIECTASPPPIPATVWQAWGQQAGHQGAVLGTHSTPADDIVFENTSLILLSVFSREPLMFLSIIQQARCEVLTSFFFHSHSSPLPCATIDIFEHSLASALCSPHIHFLSLTPAFFPPVLYSNATLLFLRLSFSPMPPHYFCA